MNALPLSMRCSTVGREIARPFAVAACRRVNVPVDEWSGDAVSWYGAWDGRGLRGVVGVVQLSVLPPEAFVIGPFTDGAPSEEHIQYLLLNEISMIPARLHIALPTSSLILLRRARYIETYTAGRYAG